MVFSSAVAGPSRLPYRAASQAVRAASSSATSTASPSSSGPAFPKRPSFRQVKRGPRAGPVAFEKWYDNFAIQYAAPQRGRAAKWMGGNVVSSEVCDVARTFFWPWIFPASLAMDDHEPSIHADRRSPSPTTPASARRPRCPTTCRT